MDRKALSYLREWRDRGDRKPLVIRGARQVGKSFLVRQFAHEAFDNIVEVNFENEPSVASYFSKSDIDATLSLLAVHFKEPIRPGRTLLFLDEVQAAPEVFARLRYFYEKKPDLHVIAAGSLLEFILEDHDFSMPVGRAEYLHLGPFTFDEFLVATGEKGLLDFMETYVPEDDFPVGIHLRLTDCLRNYTVVGGMPESIKAFCGGNDYLASERVLQSIIQTFADDFAKYNEKIKRGPIAASYTALPRLIGGKLKYVNISRQYRAVEIAEALRMLELARVVYLVRHSCGQGLPLGAMVNPKVFKPLFLDVGLVLNSLGYSPADLAQVDLMLVNAGAVCEQFIGQHLLYRQAFFKQPELYYWVREKPSASAEIDYLISIGPQVFPVEVKAGKTGSLRSLHQFMVTHDCPLAIRLNMDIPSFIHADGRLPTGKEYSYPLLSLPLYMVSQVERLTTLAQQANT